MSVATFHPEDQARATGIDIVPDVVRLCAMNMYLHGAAHTENPITRADALINKTGEYEVLTNPPFGKKRSYTIVGRDGEIETEREESNRTDFIKTTSNKQLNFVQHIMSILKIDGRCAVVLPDNVLFEGAGADIRKRLLHMYDFHTLLRRPTGIQAGRQSKRAVLRSQAMEGKREQHQGALDLRLAHQPALHAEGAANEAGRPGRLRRVLSCGQSPEAQGERVFP